MKPHNKLTSLQSLLPTFFTYFKESNILAISEDKSTLPFCIVISDKKNLLLSVAVDYPISVNVADVAIKSSSIGTTLITEPFYISIPSGQTFLDDEAYRRWDLDAIDLNTIDAISEELH